MEGTILNNKRICYACDSETTYIKKNGKPAWHWWDGYLICHACRSRYVDAPICHQKFNKTHNDKYNPRKIWFKDKVITLKANPRVGVCSWCDKEGLTHMHHIAYHDEDPLKDTVELCPTCHAKESVRLQRKKAAPAV